ncbi:MAG0770 family lipoprotein [Mycoplasmopsis felifaucium]|uniref:MAG0770 family lipoprotein n=1 Tax=Mycoplasmopsis felifaucium TaxID=35768 RepID=UPI00048286A0|nr:hypothetical protein [Mycoplasmopsis felifaucium]
MNKKLRILSAVLILSATALPVLSSSCKLGSFYNTQKVFETEYSKEIHEAYNNYKNAFDNVIKFVSNSENYQKFYLNNYKTVKNITNAWDEFIHKYGDYLDLKENNDFVYSIKLGFNENNNFTELKVNDYKFFDNKIINIQNELSNATDNINIRTQLTYIKALNNEINLIISDYVEGLQNPSSSIYGEFNEIFNLYVGYPLFNNSSNKKILKINFINDIKTKYSEMLQDYNNKYYDSTKIDIDYENLNPKNIEGQNYHTHALYNLWNEWNASIAPQILEGTDQINWKPNRVKKVADFFEKLYKTANFVKKTYDSNLVLLVLDKKNKVVDSLDLLEVFSVFNNSLFENFDTFKLRIIVNSNNPKKFGNFWKNDLDKLNILANKILRIISDYE